MATSEMLWRRLPIGLIRDEDMDLIADQLPKELSAAPYMFYLTALCKADNDGIFDLEDGVIFSRLMRIGTPEDVFTIANLMMKRKIILRAGESTRCILCNWEYPSKETPRTMEQRRAIVAEKIKQEKKLAIDAEFKINTDNTPALPPFFETKHQDGAVAVAASNAVFFDSYDDKNAKNVVEKKYTEREKERIEREETHTETEDKRETERLAFQALPGALQASEKKDNPEKLDIEIVEEEQDQEDVPCWSEHRETAANEKRQEGEEDLRGSKLFCIIKDFFTKNNLGFNVIANEPELMAIYNRIHSLGDTRNPPEIIAGVFLTQFKRLTEEDPYYKNAPLTPEQLLKPGTYSHVLNATSKILLTQAGTNSAWLKQEEKYAAEAQAEKAAVGNTFEAEYIKYGIDPSDPNKVTKLMKAKANESRETNPP